VARLGKSGSITSFLLEGVGMHLCYNYETRLGSTTLGPYVCLVLVLGIRIRRIRMFLGFPNPDPLVRGPDPNPAPSLFY
jgi:hypothetical protein